MLGKTPDDINRGIANFIKTQQQLGISSAQIQRDLAQQSNEFIKNLDIASKLTGENNAQLQAKLDQALAEDAFAAAQFELKKKADAGDIKKMTRKINGGYIGLEDRIRHYEHALHVMGA
jgi:DNA-binding transcriptional MerR regulator